MIKSPFFQFAAAVVTAILSTSCSNSFFQVRNPFDSETAAVKSLTGGNKSDAAAKDPGPDALGRPVVADPDLAEYTGSTVPSAASEPSPEKAPPTVSDPPPPRTYAPGKVCYRCNGKGFRFVAADDVVGDRARCETCGGSGRH